MPRLPSQLTSILFIYGLSNVAYRPSADVAHHYAFKEVIRAYKRTHHYRSLSAPHYVSKATDPKLKVKGGTK